MIYVFIFCDYALCKWQKMRRNVTPQYQAYVID